MKTIFSIFKIILSLAIFFAIVPLILYYSYFWGMRILEGGLMGGDIAYHISWIHTLARFYPQIPVWFPFAGAGSSIVLGYWVFPYYLAIIGSHLSSLSAEQWIRILEFLTVPIVSLEIYLYLLIRKKNHVMAAIGAFLYPLSSIAWGWVSQAGFFSMQISTVFYLPAFLFFDLYLESELTNSDKISRKRFYLLGYAFFTAFGFLTHGSFFPNFYLGLPIYALIRSQFLPRAKEKRILSFLKAVKVLVIAIPLGFLSGAFIFLPQQKYFGLQPFVPTYGAGDTPILPWKAFLGFERLQLSVGSLYVPLFLSYLVSVFALAGVFIGLIKRSFLGALGVVGLFYVFWLSSAQYLATNFPFLQIFILPTATRISSLTGIYFTVIAAYGIWSLADLPGVIIRFLGRKLGQKGKAGRVINFSLENFAFIISSFLAIIILGWAFYNFRTHQVYPPNDSKWGFLGAYEGYGTFGYGGVLCRVPGWEKVGVQIGKKCSDYNLNFKVATGSADFWPKDFAESVDKLNLDKTTRVSVSSLLGWVVFSFANHTDASLVSAPSGQSVIILDWLGIHDKTLFLEGEETSEEVSEMAKWFGIKYVFLTEEHKKVYPKEIWPIRLTSNGVVARELKNSPGLATLSTKPAVLVIGSKEKQAYILSFRTAVKGGMSFDNALLIQGTPYIDDYSLKELKYFKGLILQGFSYHDRGKAWNLLSDFVKDGGSVYLETGWQYVNKDWGAGPDKNGDFLPVSLPNPSPVNKTFWGNIGDNWDNAILQTEIGKGVDLEGFSSPKWGDKSWGMALSEKDDLSLGAEPVLSSDNKVVIARGNYGEGKIVWSGMNLFSYAFDKEGKEEYLLIGNIFKYLLGEEEPEKGNVSIAWDYPDRIDLTLSNVPQKPAFLYWAETFTPNWGAYLEREEKKENLKIYKAGPGFKALRLTDLSEGDKVVFKHSIKNTLLVSFGITFLTFFIILFSIFDSLILKQKFENRIKGIFGKHIDLIKSKGERRMEKIKKIDEEDY